MKAQNPIRNEHRCLVACDSPCPTMDTISTHVFDAASHVQLAKCATAIPIFCPVWYKCLLVAHYFVPHGMCMNVTHSFSFRLLSSHFPLCQPVIWSFRTNMFIDAFHFLLRHHATNPITCKSTTSWTVAWTIAYTCFAHTIHNAFGTLIGTRDFSILFIRMCFECAN